MYYASYNDYELIYLISEGSEIALNLLYKKYYIYINKIVSKFSIPSHKREDMIQEGVDIFFRSIKNFNPDKYSYTFFNYFKISLERRIYRILKRTTYYDSNLVFSEVDFVDYNSGRKGKVDIYKSLLLDEEEKEIFEECFIKGVSLGDLAKAKNLTYKKIYYKAICLRERLKKY
jgi:hypothetical protein